MNAEDNRSRTSPHPPLDDYYGDGAERRRFLTKIFDETAPAYDSIAALMSFGSGAWYRRKALQRSGLRNRMRVLDVAVGTGEVARGAVTIVGAAGRVVGIDPSIGMLLQARRKLDMAVVQGVGEDLPFRDGLFDFVTMGYALRHLVDLGHTFTEYCRVLKPGGTLLILDFVRPRSQVGLSLGRFYLGTIVPWMSRLRFGAREQLLMRYCWDTVEELVPPGVVVEAMNRAGFEKIAGARFALLSEYVARKP